MPDPVRMQGEALKSTGARTMFGAVVLVGIGIAVTAITYRNAASGGTYIFAWGPIIIGGFTFFRGLFQYLRGSSVLRRAGGGVTAPPPPAAGLPAAPPPVGLPAAPPPAWTPPAAPQPQWTPPAGPPAGPPSQPPERAV